MQLWQEIGQLASERDVRVGWAKAHAENALNLERFGCQAHQANGNYAADVLAKMGAELCVDPVAARKRRKQQRWYSGLRGRCSPPAVDACTPTDSRLTT